MLKEGLESCGYKRQSAADACVFIGNTSIVIVYVDDCVVFQHKGARDTDELIRNLQDGEQKFVFTDNGDLETYLGVDVKRKKDGSIELSQLHLLTRIITLLNISDGVNSKPSPIVKPLLCKDLE